MLPRNVYRAREKPREAGGRPELTLHYLRHTGLTWLAATGAPIPELMRRGGHFSPRAAIGYQMRCRRWQPEPALERCGPRGHKRDRLFETEAS